jgi:transcriptional regulator with PAS, ATPase and Fis domain
MLFSGRIISLNGVKHLLTIARDVSDMIQLNKKLEKNSVELNSILDSLDDFVFVFNKEKKFIRAHIPKGARNSLYLPENKFIGKKHAQILPKDVDKKFNHAFSLAQKGKISDYEYSLKIGKKNRDFYARIIPQFNSQVFEGVLAIIKEKKMPSCKCSGENFTEKKLENHKEK